MINDDMESCFFLTLAAPDPPVLMSAPSLLCNSNGNQVNLQWIPPTNTGGQGVMIDRYLVTVSGPAGYTCPTDQCNVTTTSTTLTGLECGSTYMVSVSAVNCIGESGASNTIMINLRPPGLSFHLMHARMHGSYILS